MLLFHEVIGKRTSALNQLRDGLKLLGVLDVIENNPKLCEPLFVYDESSLTPTTLKSILRFDNCPDEVKQHVLQYVTTSSKKNLENFVKFVTGGSVLPTSISIKMSDHDKAEGIFASTCSKEIVLPTVLKDYSELSELLDSVLNPSLGKSFTSV